MKIRRFCFFIYSLFSIFGNCTFAQSSTVVAYPGPSTMTTSANYSVTVAGKKIFVYEAMVGNFWNASLGKGYTDSVKMGMAYFDFDGGTVPVVIEFKNKSSISTVDFYPTNKGITPIINGNKISFNLNSHQRMLLRLDSTVSGSFMLFANPILPRPNLSDTNLLYYGPGEYFIGGNGKGTISLNSNQTLFLDGGAVVHGYVAVPEKNNVTITGRGILDGSYIPWKNNKGQTFISITGSSNINISGITIQNSPHWTVVPTRSNNINIDNVKIVNYRNNSDGIDPVNSQFVTIKNSFLATGDDCISPKGSVWNFTYPGSYLQNSFQKTTDISVTNCLLWTNKAGYALSRVGDESVTDSICRLTYEDNEVIATDAPFGINIMDRAAVNNVTVENFRISENYSSYVLDFVISRNEYSTDTIRGTINNVYCRNILSKRNAWPRCFGFSPQKQVSNVTFEGVKGGSSYQINLGAITPLSANYFNVNIISAGTTAGQVFNRYVKDIKKDSAFISWEACPAYQSFQLRYRLLGTSVWTTIVGSDNNGVQLSNLSSDTTYEWQIRTVCSSGTHDWSILQTFKTALPISWTGATNSNWSSASNWSSNTLPDVEADINIPSGLTNYPILGANTTIGKLTIQSGSTLSLNGKALTINGNVNGTGVFVGSSASNLQVNGNGTIYFSQTNPGVSNVLNALTVAATDSVVLGNTLNLINLLKPTSGLFNTGDNLVLKSTSITNSAIVGQVGGSVSGKVTVERFIPKGYRAYRDMSAGVFNAGTIFSNWQEGGSYVNSGYGIFITGGTPATSGTTNSVEGTTGFDKSINAVKSAWTYRAGVWSNLVNTNATNLNPFLGYRILIRGDRSFNIFTTPITPTSLNVYPMVNATTLRTKGQLVTGNVTYSVSGVQNSVSGSTYVNSSFGLNSAANGFSSVANPYVCPIDWKLIYDNGRMTNLQPSYYYLDPTFGSVGAYVSYNPVSNVSSIGTLNRRFIQAGQAFFVQNAATGSPRLIITEAEKSDTATKMGVFGTAVGYSKIFIGLLKQNGTDYKQMDGAVSVFNTSFSNNYGAEDAIKMGNAFDNLAVSNSLAITHGFYNLSIDGRKPVVNGDSILIYLNSLSDVNGYRLQFDLSQYTNTGLNPYLYDKYLLNYIAIGSGITNVDITLDTSNMATYQNRFAVVFKIDPFAHWGH